MDKKLVLVSDEKMDFIIQRLDYIEKKLPAYANSNSADENDIIGIKQAAKLALPLTHKYTHVVVPK